MHFFFFFFIFAVIIIPKLTEDRCAFRLDNAFEFKVPEEVYTVTTALLMRQHAQQQVAQIITCTSRVQQSLQKL